METIFIMTQYEKMQEVIENYKKHFGPNAYPSFIYYGIESKYLTPGYSTKIPKEEEDKIKNVLSVMSEQLEKYGQGQQLKENKKAEDRDWVYFGYKTDPNRHLDIKCRVYIPIKPESQHDTFFAECLKLLINSSMNFSGKIAKIYRNDSLTFEFEDKEQANKFVNMISQRPDLMKSLGEKNPFLEDANGMGVVDFSNFDSTQNSYTNIVAHELENYMFSLNDHNLDKYKTATLAGFREFLSEKAKERSGDASKLLTQIVSQIDECKQEYNQEFAQKQPAQNESFQPSIKDNSKSYNPRSAKDSLIDLKELFERYQVVVNGKNVDLVDRKTQKPINMDRENKIETIRKVTLAEKWIESAGYGLSKTLGENEFGIDPRQYEYAFNEQAKETFTLMIEKMQWYKQQGKSFDINEFAKDIQEKTKYKYSENLVYGLLSYPNPKTPDGYQKIMDGVPQKTEWQYSSIKTAIMDITNSDYLIKNDLNANLKNTYTAQPIYNKNDNFNEKENFDYSSVFYDKISSNDISVKTKDEQEMPSDVPEDNLDKKLNVTSEVDDKTNENEQQNSVEDFEKSTENSGLSKSESNQTSLKKTNSIIQDEIHPIRPYVTNRGLVNEKFDKFLAFLDSQVIANEKLLNNQTIKKPFVNMDAVYSLLLDKCKTQMDYRDLEMVLKFANDLGGIATGYYDVCKGILSKIHIKYMKDEDIEELKGNRQNTIDRINTELSNNPLYSKLNINSVVQQIKAFEDSPSVQAKDRVSLYIRYSIEKCENQEDYDFLKDCIDHISSYSLYSSVFVFDNNYSGLSKDLNGEFDDIFLKLNNNSINIEEKMFKERYGVEITHPSSSVEETSYASEETSKEGQIEESVPPQKIDKYKKIKFKIILCNKILTERNYLAQTVFQSMNDIDKFVNETAPSEIKDLKESISEEEYNDLVELYNKTHKLYIFVKEDIENKKTTEQSDDVHNLIQEVDDFIAEVKSKASGENGSVEFDADVVESKSLKYRNQLNAIQGDIDVQTFNKLDGELSNLLHLCSQASYFSGGM